MEVNLFKVVYKGNNGVCLWWLVRLDFDELDLCVYVIKFESLSDKDRINLDKLKELYCIYYFFMNIFINVLDDEDLYDLLEDRLG